MARALTFEALTVVLILILIAIFTYIDSRQYMLEGFTSNNDTNNDTQLMLFYADWCGHCKRMKPEWEKVKSEFPGRCIDVESESITDRHRNQYNVKGYPSIFVVKGEEITEYDGERTYTAFREVLTN